MPACPDPPSSGDGDAEASKSDHNMLSAARDRVQLPPPPPPGHVPYAQPAFPVAMRRPGNGVAIASLVLGITSIVFFYLGMATLALVVLAMVFGAMGINLANRNGARYRRLAIAGLICGCVGGVIYLIFGVLSGGIFLVI